MSPHNFLWAKNLLSTKLPQLLQTDSGTFEFSVLVSCPESNFSCVAKIGEKNEPFEEEHQPKEKEVTQASLSPSSRKRTARKPIAVVETEVRRSKDSNILAGASKLMGVLKENV